MELRDVALLIIKGRKESLFQIPMTNNEIIGLFCLKTIIIQMSAKRDGLSHL